MVHLNDPVTAILAQETSPVAVTAATLDGTNDYQEGFCPVCQAPSVLSTCSGIPVYVCLEHRVVLPTKEQEC
jgi:hypothetical protein